MKVPRMTRRKLIQTIPRVPSNLPIFLDALVAEVLHSQRVNLETQNQLVERQPRQGLTAILEAEIQKYSCCITIVIELIPLANSVGVYLETGFMGGPFRTAKGLMERLFASITERAMLEGIDQILALESQNYGMPVQTREILEPEPSQIPSQTNFPSETASVAVVYCPACGIANPAEAHICEACGTELAR
jgi:hypothetical protein